MQSPAYKVAHVQGTLAWFGCKFMSTTSGSSAEKADPTPRGYNNKEKKIIT